MSINLQILDYHFLPVTHKMAENVRACLLETEEVTRIILKVHRRIVNIITGA